MNRTWPLKILTREKKGDRRKNGPSSLKMSKKRVLFLYLGIGLSIHSNFTPFLDARFSFGASWSFSSLQSQRHLPSATMAEVASSQSILHRDAAQLDAFLGSVKSNPEKFAVPSKQLSQQALKAAKTLFDHGS